MCITLAAQAQTFGWSGTWTDGNPPTILGWRTGHSSDVEDKTRLITISGTPTGTLEVPLAVELTIRGSITGYNGYLTIDCGANARITWEANLTGGYDVASNGLVRVVTNSYDRLPYFELVGSISSSGRAPALSSDNVPITVSGNGMVRNTSNKPAGYVYKDCAAIWAYAPVTVKDNAQVIAAGGGSAIITSCNGADVTVSGGLVFGAGSVISGVDDNITVILLYPGTTLNQTGGTIIGWDKAAGHTSYQANSTRDLIKQPSGATAKWVSQSSQAGISWTNGGASGFIPISGVAIDDTKPTVSSVSPSGAGALGTGNVVVTFNEAMDTQVAGTVALNGNALAAGTWSNGNKTYTAPYSALASSAAYTVNISGFADLAQNVMNADNSHSFTTTATVPTGISIKNQPKLNYEPGWALDLSGLVITIAFNNATYMDIPFADFGNYDITTRWTANGIDEPAENGQTLSTTYSNKKIEVKYAGFTATTDYFGVFTAYFRVGETIYSSLGYAANAVPNGGVIVLLRDMTISSSQSANTSNTFTLDLGGFTITGTSTGNNSYTNGYLYFSGGGNVTLQNGTITTAADNAVHIAHGTGGGMLTIKSGTYHAAKAALVCENSNAVIEAGSFSCDNSSTTGCIVKTGTYGSGIALAAGSQADPTPWLNVDAAKSVRVTKTSDFADAAAPVLAAGTVSRASDTEAAIGFTTNKAGTAYCLVQNSGETAPSNTAVKAANNSLGSVSGTVSGKAVTLTAGAKDIYIVVEDAAGNISNSLKIAAAAYATTPVISGYMTRTSATDVVYGFTTNKDGTIYYVYQEHGDPEPTKEEVRAADIFTSDLPAGTYNNIPSDRMPPGALDIYLVLEDEEGNLSEVLKIELAAYVPLFVGISVNGSAALYSVADVESAITSALASSATVTVTGELTGAADMLVISIPAGKKVEWNANYSGNVNDALIMLLGDGEFELAGGTVSNSFTNGEAFILQSTYATKLTVSGGTIDGGPGNAIFVNGPNKTVVLSGGTLTNAALNQATVNVWGANSVVFINGCTVTNTRESALRINFYPGINAMAIEKTGAGTTYAQYASTDLTVYSNTETAAQATAKWDIVSGVSGITYENGTNTGFLPVEGVTVTDVTAPVLTAGSVNRTSDTAATISFTTDEDGTAYYIVVESGADVPTKEEVKAGASLGTVTTGAVSDLPITLTAGAKDIYVIVEDAAGNISEPLKIEAAANIPPLAGTLSITLNTHTGVLEGDISAVTGGAGAFNYEWSGAGVANATTDALLPSEYTPGQEVTLTLTSPGATGSLSATITVWRVDITAAGAAVTDELKIDNPYTTTNGSIAIDYTLGMSGTYDNRIEIACGQKTVHTSNNPDSRTTYYMFDPTDAVSGVVTLTATFTHISSITLATIQGVAAPIAGAAPVTAITETAQYSGTVAWNPDDATFAYATAYTATITLTPKTGHTLSGVAEDFFIVPGATTTTFVSGDANSRIITAVFPETESPPAYGVSIGTLSNGTVTLDRNPADYAEGETVTLTVAPDTGYELDDVWTTPTVETRLIASLQYEFTMPAYGVTVTATFQKTADQTAVETAQSLIEGMTSIIVAQAKANTEIAVKEWLAEQINDLSGMSTTGITVSASNITLSSFTAATAGTANAQSGTDGSFTFTVSLKKGNSTTVTTTAKSGAITATAYDATHDNADITAAKAAIEAATFTDTQINIPDIAAARTKVTQIIAGLGLNGITTALIDETFEAAVPGTQENLSGTDGSYTFKVNINKGGGMQQTTVQLTLTITATPLVNAASPAISGQPQGATVTAGASVTLTVTATSPDGGTLSYQWYSNSINSNTGGAAVGTNSNSYSPSTAAAGTVYYYVVVTNTNNSVNGTKTATAISSVATVTVNALVNAQAPNITAHPQNATYTQNGAATALSVTASVSDGGALSYQWYRNTANSNSGGTAVGTNSVNYTPSTASTGTYYYYVVITNTNNSVNGTKTATATSSVAAVTVNAIVNAQTPNITGQPQGATVTAGNPVTLTVSANVTDGGTLSYQWYSNTANANSGGAAVGTNSSSYSPPTATAGTSYYYVVVTNTNNSVNGTKTATATSNAATVTVNAPVPTYTVTVAPTTNGSVSASPATATAGTTVTLTVTPATGYELDEISTTPVVETLHATSLPNTYEFAMPASDIIVDATFKKTQAQLDREAAEAAKSAIEGGTYRVAQGTANDAASVKTWLVNTLNVLFGQSHGIQLRAATSIVGDVEITAITPAIAGTETDPDGTNGSFTFTVLLTRGATTLAATVPTGVIVATPYSTTPLKRIELSLIDDLTVRITNTGNTATGELTLALSGSNADVFTPSQATVSSLPVGGETYITLTPNSGLAQGTYTATLTVEGEGIAPVSVEITYTVTFTGIDNPQANVLKVYIQNGMLHVSGLTAGKLWSVYSVAGVPVYQGIANGDEAEVYLPVRGVYIVKSGIQTVKVVY